MFIPEINVISKKSNNQNEIIKVKAIVNVQDEEFNLAESLGAEHAEIIAIFTKEQLIDVMNAHKDKIDVYTTVSGYKAKIRVTSDGKHLTTNPDNTKHNNLDNLPDM